MRPTCNINGCSELVRVAYHKNTTQIHFYGKRCPAHSIKYSERGTRTKNPLNGLYWGMISRCYYPNRKNYKYYGARGITVCERWRNSFVDFCKDVGLPPGKIGPHSDEYSLDRIDNDGPYSPENCRWATRAEQQANRGNK